MRRENMLWSERKRNALGLPWTFTVYLSLIHILVVEELQAGRLAAHDVRVVREIELSLLHALPHDVGVHRMYLPFSVVSVLLYHNLTYIPI